MATSAEPTSQGALGEFYLLALEHLALAVEWQVIHKLANHNMGKKTCPGISLGDWKARKLGHANVSLLIRSADQVLGTNDTANEARARFVLQHLGDDFTYLLGYLRQISRFDYFLDPLQVSGKLQSKGLLLLLGYFTGIRDLLPGFFLNCHGFYLEKASLPPIIRNDRLKKISNA